MAIRKTKLVVLAGFLLLLPGLLMPGASTNAQKRRTGGSASRAAQPAAQFKTCPVCNGSGKTHEHVAKHEEVRCSNCAATGKIICDGGDRVLKGAPHQYNYIGKNRDLLVCQLCYGTGLRRCPECYGSGVRRMDRGYDVTKVCHNCRGNGRVQLTREEIRAKEEARLEVERERVREELRAKEEARLEAESAERAERERVRLEAERRKIEELREKEWEDARANLESVIAFANSLAPLLKNSIGMELNLIKPGDFLMGGNGGNPNEKPAHLVVIIKPFYMSKYEVTQAQWRAVMGSNPSYFKGDNLPVEKVSWDDVKEFCRKLSQMTGQEYRLPSEAEWEYACRAGTIGTYDGDLDAIAWHGKNSGSRTHPVGQKQPNAFGLFDMLGNVNEWCEDVYQDNYYGAPRDGSPWLSDIKWRGRVVRVGSWAFSSKNLHCGIRSSGGGGESHIGFRVVMSARNP